MNDYYYLVLCLVVGVFIVVVLFVGQTRKKVASADPHASMVMWGFTDRSMLKSLKPGLLSLREDKLLLRDEDGTTIFDEKVAAIKVALHDPHAPMLSYRMEWRFVLPDGRRICLQVRRSLLSGPHIAPNRMWLETFKKHTYVNIAFGASPNFKQGQVVASLVVIALIVGILIANGYFG